MISHTEAGAASAWLSTEHGRLGLYHRVGGSFSQPFTREQRREILKAEIRELRAELAKRKGVGAK